MDKKNSGEWCIMVVFILVNISIVSHPDFLFLLVSTICLLLFVHQDMALMALSPSA